MADFALVEPWHHGRHFVGGPWMPSYGLAKLAGFGRAVILDGCVLGRDGLLQALREGEYRMVGVTAQTPHRHPAKEILRVAKEAGARTVVGGYHATAMPAFFDESFVDHIVRGEGEFWWDRLVRGVDVPRVTKILRDTVLDDYPAGDWSALLGDPFERYQTSHWHDAPGPLFPVALSYGCPGHCIYCMCPFLHGAPHWRSVEHVLDEVRALYDWGGRAFWFIDECFGVERSWALALCSELAGFEGLHWLTFMRADMLEGELLQVMAGAGCRAIIVGFESADPEMLRRLGKGTVDVACYDAGVLAAKAAGINVSASIMCGLPYETDDHVPLTETFLARHDLVASGVGSTWVMPGMPLYRLCQEAGLIDDRFWDGPAQFYRYRGGLAWTS